MAQQLPNPKAREHAEKYHRARRLLQDAKQCRNPLDGKHNGHPGPLGALTHHAYGIHIKQFAAASVPPAFDRPILVVVVALRWRCA